MAKPANGIYYAPFQEAYISKVNSDTVPAMVSDYTGTITTFYNALPEAKQDYAYAQDKWTVKDVLQHVIDTERILSYRVLRIARNDQTPIPGFEENDYAITANAGSRSLDALKEEFTALRKSTDLLLLSITEEQFNNTGTSNNTKTSANALAFIIYGHLLHHKEILEQRYL
ncbi:DinB superfamily protein [Filimonas lacunae]|uniref:DinB superfamily protein n=1 Tax=Filimonas lacunae TaxID=477680 RepID=A0A173MCF4_9BACT|nr:DinB family protein [Filimonas lacunae]BAV05207.1 hypothetical protein FLA_1214 [Filimonas lacunae]SIT22636.1 DinB superfamily protein [Filimonas lacunae]